MTSLLGEDHKTMSAIHSGHGSGNYCLPGDLPESVVVFRDNIHQRKTERRDRISPPKSVVGGNPVPGVGLFSVSSKASVNKPGTEKCSLDWSLVIFGHGSVASNTFVF